MLDLQAGQTEAIATVSGDGAEHVLVVETIIGLKERRPEMGELTATRLRRPLGLRSGMPAPFLQLT